jgi:hypothetical protein
MAKNVMDETIDWNEFDQLSTVSYRDYWDKELNYPQNLMRLMRRCVALPNSDVMIPIAVTYAITHSVACSTVPILFFQGKSGTGKSIASYLMAAFRDEVVNIIGSSSTFASIRNKVQELRWFGLCEEYPDYSRSNELPYILVYADIKEDNLDDTQMYGMFRNGFTRSEDCLTISKGDGKNILFRVFGLKVLSSTSDFFTRAKWSELARRLLVIQTKPIDELSDNDLSGFNNGNQLDPYLINWSGIKHDFRNHWTKERINHLAKLMRRKGDMKIDCLKKGMGEHQFTASFDLMVTAIASNIFPDPDFDNKTRPASVIKLFCDYWEYNHKHVVLGHTALHSVCESIINELLANTREVRQAVLDTGKKIDPLDMRFHDRLDAKQFMAHLLRAKVNGAVYSGNPESIVSAMLDLGFKQVSEHGKHVWVRV